MPKRRPQEDDENDDDGDSSENWKHDDVTERSVHQRRADELRRHSESMAHTYQKTKELWEQIQKNLRNAWKKDAA